MEHLIQTAAQALNRINECMDRDNMDPVTRTRIVDFAELNRRSLRLHLTPQQQQLLDQVPYRPALTPPQQGNQPAAPPAAAFNVPPAAWSRDDFEDGSMRYLRKIVALQQLAYSFLCITHSPFTHTAQFQEVLQFTQQQLQHSVSANELSEAVRHNVSALQTGWKRTVARHASATVPRTQEAVNLVGTEAERIGLYIIDSERIKKTLQH